MWKEDDERTLEHGYTINSPVQLRLRVDVNEELKYLGKFKKKKIWGGGGGGGGVWLGGQDGCEQVFVKIKKKKNWGGGGGVGLGGSGWM